MQGNRGREVGVLPERGEELGAASGRQKGQYYGELVGAGTMVLAGAVAAFSGFLNPTNFISLVICGIGTGASYFVGGYYGGKNAFAHCKKLGGVLAAKGGTEEEIVADCSHEGAKKGIESGLWVVTCGVATAISLKGIAALGDNLDTPISGNTTSEDLFH